MVLTLKESLVECATVCFKSEVILPSDKLVDYQTTGLCMILCFSLFRKMLFLVLNKGSNFVLLDAFCPGILNAWNSLCTGKSLSEALILESVNPKYDDRLFIELQVQYKKNTSSEHVVYKNSFFVFVLTFKTLFVHNMF